jgi:hypothetical protein
VTRWADDPTGHLRSVEDHVSGMESALVTGNLPRGTACANALVAVTTELLETLGLDQNRDPETEVELVSMLRVYRNAAFVFRKMAGASGEPDPALRTLCVSLIEQGHDHRRALEIQSPEQGRSTE